MLFRSTVTTWSWGTPILYHRAGSELQVVTVGANHVGGYRAADGKRTFTFAGASPAMVASPVIDGDTLYAIRLRLPDQPAFLKPPGEE